VKNFNNLNKILSIIIIIIIITIVIIIKIYKRLLCVLVQLTNRYIAIMQFMHSSWA